VDGEVVVEAATVTEVLDALEAAHPVLRGTMRDPGSSKRRAFVRFFACQEDLSHSSYDEPLPAAVVEGREPFLVVGAMAGG
jgi:molybdopterin synthase sulfur carrier subunit